MQHRLLICADLGTTIYRVAKQQDARDEEIELDWGERTHAAELQDIYSAGVLEGMAYYHPGSVDRMAFSAVGKQA